MNLKELEEQTQKLVTELKEAQEKVKQAKASNTPGLSDLQEKEKAARSVWLTVYKQKLNAWFAVENGNNNSK